jgi:LPXTG-motif cell wall-anchored protein
MIALTGNTTMLYCPRCRRTYEDGTQRFCDNDGGRLLPAPSAQDSETKKGGVFTNLLGKTPTAADADQKINPTPRFIPFNKTEETDKKLTSFPSAGRIFQSEQFLKPKTEELEEGGEDSILELEPLAPRETEETVLEFEPVLKTEEAPAEDSRDAAPKPAPRLIKPGEIASGTADVGNRKTNPLGRKALSWENPEALFGQTVKGRYQITKELEEDDEDSLIYLAEDRIVAGKRVVVRVFMDEDFGTDDTEEKIFSEERVSLSHLNHPNIASVFDSGELPEGNTFIVSEFVEGELISEILRQTGQFNVHRTARIIRQTSYALSEAHQNGILHRNLKPENIVLTISEAGIEQVKLMNFGVSRGEITDWNLVYKAPEEIEKGISTYASDIYTLAVIAYQMLTGRVPFGMTTESAILKAQRQGMTLPPTSLRLDVQPLADKILEKALAFNPSDRYPKARDFGDAFFNALTTAAPWTDEDETETQPVEEIEKQREFFVIAPINQKEVRAEESPVGADIHIAPKFDDAETAEIKTPEPPAWEKRSPDLPQTGTSWRSWAAIAGVIALLLVFWGISRVIVNRSNQPENIQNPGNQNSDGSTQEKAPEIIPVDGDMPPPTRLQKTPAGFQRFQNSRESLKGDLAKNFLGFEIFYPQNWTVTPTETNFLDISKRTANNFPVEQMIITRYESRGTMMLDKPNFPKLVEKSNQDLKKSLGSSFKVVAEGDVVLGSGWKAYEVKFESTGESEKGEKITLWGRRLWIPVQVAGKQNGFVLTLLATSLSETVKSVDEVGVKGELAGVLETFEPEQR